jgi:hypothetical protein
MMKGRWRSRAASLRVFGRCATPLLPTAVILLSVIVCLAAAPAAAQVAAPAPRAASEYIFPSGAGILVFHVRPDRTAEFERVVARLAEVLSSSTDPVRQQQATGWAAFRSVEPVKDAALYVFVFDPAVPTADYDPVKLLGEAVPADAQLYYDTLRAAVLKVERLALTRVP